MPSPAIPPAGTTPCRVHEGAAAIARLGESTRSLTPFQSADFLEPLLIKTGGLASFRLIEIGMAKDALLLPVSIRQRGPCRIADIAGGRQASYHAANLCGDAAIPASSLREALLKAGREAGIDAFTFTDCPLSYAGCDNPLALPNHQPSPSSGWALTLERDADALLARLSDKDDRKKLRQKVNRLAALGAIEAGWAETPEARAAAFGKLFRWKAERFGAMGIDDPFSEPGMREFLGHAAQNGALRLFTLHAGSRLVAVLAGASSGGCFSGMLNGHENEPEIARSSPGEQLIVHLIRALCSEGYSHFDLGVGEARYKAHYCPERISLADCAIGVSVKGLIVAKVFLAARAAKRLIKQNPKLMEWLGQARRLGRR